MDEKQREQIVNKVISEVLNRVQEPEQSETGSGSVVALITSYVPSYQKAEKVVHELFGNDITYIDFYGYSFPIRPKSVVNYEEKDRDSVIELVNNAEKITLITPRLKLLENIAGGDDEGFVEYLTIRSLLWERSVSMVLDFVPPAFKRNSFHKKISDIVEVLEGIGVEILTYDCGNKLPSARTLVTESDIVEAWKSGYREVRTAAGCIITPSARDKAGELEIKII